MLVGAVLPRRGVSSRGSRFAVCGTAPVGRTRFPPAVGVCPRVHPSEPFGHRRVSDSVGCGWDCPSHPGTPALHPSAPSGSAWARRTLRRSPFVGNRGVIGAFGRAGSLPAARIAAVGVIAAALAGAIGASRVLLLIRSQVLRLVRLRRRRDRRGRRRAIIATAANHERDGDERQRERGSNSNGSLHRHRHAAPPIRGRSGAYNEPGFGLWPETDAVQAGIAGTGAAGSTAPVVRTKTNAPPPPALPSELEVLRRAVPTGSVNAADPAVPPLSVPSRWTTPKLSIQNPAVLQVPPKFTHPFWNVGSPAAPTVCLVSWAVRA